MAKKDQDIILQLKAVATIKEIRTRISEDNPKLLVAIEREEKILLDELYVIANQMFNKTKSDAS
jgi:hypothetical protein